MTSTAGSRRLNLALQGGGAHGAFTWGVLDTLLESGCIEIGWLSGTSAGAVNAVAVASGLAATPGKTSTPAGRDEARRILAALWRDVAATASPDLLDTNPLLKSWAEAAAASLPPLATMFSPYDLNPLGLDPLGEILKRHVDFARIAATEGPELLIAATEVASGRARLFRRRELTVRAVLASACLPVLHRAVTIDGTAYWDGGFSANPDITTLGLESPVTDTLIVQLNPSQVEDLPMSARAIAAHVNHLTFQQPLIREADFIVAARRASRRWLAGPRGPYAALARHRYHLISAAAHVAHLPPVSRVAPDREIIEGLCHAGRTEARAWLDRHQADIGRRETLDLATAFAAA